MTTDAPALLKETERRIRDLLPAAICDALKIVIDDEPLVKGNAPKLRLRLYGKRLLGFWSSRWCFYEIGVGRYSPMPSEGWNVGAAGLFCAARQKACGDGKYIPELRDVLIKARSERPQDFSLICPGDVVNGEEKPWFFLQRRYLGAVFGTFSPKQAAHDAAWIITTTYPPISAMLARS